MVGPEGRHGQHGLDFLIDIEVVRDPRFHTNALATITERKQHEEYRAPKHYKSIELHFSSFFFSSSSSLFYAK